MDGKGRALDNIFVERLWRSVKYENVYLNVYENGLTLWKGLNDFFSSITIKGWTNHWIIKRQNKNINWRPKTSITLYGLVSQKLFPILSELICSNKT
jgi:hypothetical protein